MQIEGISAHQGEGLGKDPYGLSATLRHVRGMKRRYAWFVRRTSRTCMATQNQVEHRVDLPDGGQEAPCFSNLRRNDIMSDQRRINTWKERSPHRPLPDNHLRLDARTHYFLKHRSSVDGEIRSVRLNFS